MIKKRRLHLGEKKKKKPLTQESLATKIREVLERGS
jgi:hypothetical protein